METQGGNAKNETMYTTKELQKIFGCGVNKTYAIIHAKGFPKIKIGKQYYVPKSQFDKWATNNINREVLL